MSNLENLLPGRSRHWQSTQQNSGSIGPPQSPQIRWGLLWQYFFFTWPYIFRKKSGPTVALNLIIISTIPQWQGGIA